MIDKQQDIILCEEEQELPQELRENLELVDFWENTVFCKDDLMQMKESLNSLNMFGRLNNGRHLLSSYVSKYILNRFKIQQEKNTIKHYPHKIPIPTFAQPHRKNPRFSRVNKQNTGSCTLIHTLSQQIQKIKERNLLTNVNSMRKFLSKRIKNINLSKFVKKVEDNLITEMGSLVELDGLLEQVDIEGNVYQKSMCYDCSFLSKLAKNEVEKIKIMVAGRRILQKCWIDRMKKKYKQREITTKNDPIGRLIEQRIQL